MLQLQLYPHLDDVHTFRITDKHIIILGNEFENEDHKVVDFETMDETFIDKLNLPLSVYVHHHIDGAVWEGEEDVVISYDLLCRYGKQISNLLFQLVERMFTIATPVFNKEFVNGMFSIALVNNIVIRIQFDLLGIPRWFEFGPGFTSMLPFNGLLFDRANVATIPVFHKKPNGI